MKVFAIGVRVVALVVLAAAGLVCNDPKPGYVPSDPIVPPSGEAFGVVYVTPDGFTAVPTDVEIHVSFNRSLMDGTVGETSCRLEDADGDLVARSVTGPTGAAGNELYIEPALSLKPGTNYRVTLTTAIRDYEGNPLGAEVTWSFDTLGDSPPPSSTPTDCTEPLVFDPAAGPGMFPTVDGSAEGDTLIVWMHDELSATSPDFIRQPFVAMVSADGTVSDPLRIIDDVGDLGPPAVTMNSEGAAIVAGPRRDPDSGEHGIYAKHFDPVWGWTCADSAPGATHPAAVRDVQVVLDGAGDAVAVYRVAPTKTIPDWHIEYTEYSAGTESWSDPIVYQQDVDLGPPRIIAGEPGEFLLVTHDDEDGGGIRAIRLPSTEFVFDQAGWTSSQPEAAANDDGHGFVIWREASADDARIRVVPVSDSEPDGAAQFIDGDLPGLCGAPAIDVAEDGSAVAVWELHNAPDAYSIRASRYTPGSGWGDPVTVDTGTGMMVDPQVSIGEGGLVGITWQGPGSSFMNDGTIYAAYSTDGVDFTDPVVVNELAEPLSVYYSNSPVIFVNPHGVVTTAFETNDSGIQNVYVTICD